MIIIFDGFEMIHTQPTQWANLIYFYQLKKQMSLSKISEASSAMSGTSSEDWGFKNSDKTIFLTPRLSAGTRESHRFKKKVDEEKVYGTHESLPTA